MSATGLFDRVAGRLFTYADRMTHTWHRKLARGRILRKPRPGRILVLCYGNICRSPYAEAFLQQHLRSSGHSGIEVTSAGLYGPDRNANERATAIGKARGIDLTSHRSRLIDRAEAGEVDLILAMTRNQRRTVIRNFGVPRNRVELLGDFDGQDPPLREIPDPYGQPESVFATVFDQIERSVVGLCASWK